MGLSGHGSTTETEVYSPSSGGAAFDLRTGFPTIPSLSSSNTAPIRRKPSDRQSGVLKVITQPKTKLETRLDTMLHRNQFLLLVERFRNTDSSYSLGRIIFWTLGNGIRQSSRRVPVSVQDVNKRVTSSLAECTSPKDLQRCQGFDTRNEGKVYIQL